MLVALTKTVNLLVCRVNELTAKVEKLEQQIAKNSSNSSKPPSSDGYQKPSPKSLRKKTGKQAGGQAGHKGETLRQASKPDEIVSHGPQNCCCGASLENGELLREERRQVFDIPTPSIQVTEHVVQTVRCRCGKIHWGEFPDGINASVQYGPNIKAMAVYLSQSQHLPFERM